MPVRWETATREPSVASNDDVTWVIQPGRRWAATRRGTLVALCDGPARLTALSVLEDFYYSPPREVDDPEQTLANAIAQALFIVKYFTTKGLPATMASSGVADADGDGDGHSPPTCRA